MPVSEVIVGPVSEGIVVPVSEGIVGLLVEGIAGRPFMHGSIPPGVDISAESIGKTAEKSIVFAGFQSRAAIRSRSAVVFREQIDSRQRKPGIAVLGR